MKEFIAIIAVLLAIAGNVPYVRGVLKGTVKPHPFTWFVWSIVSGTVFFGMFAKGAGIGALPVAVSEFFTILIFILSIKFGFKNIAKIDYFFLVAAMAGFVPWILTKDPTYSVLVAVAIDVISFVPTFRKTWKEPSTEQPILFGSNVLRHILVLASLQTYNVATTMHSLAMICTNTIMVGIVLLRRRSGRSN